MHNISEILEAEEKYKKLLIAGLSEDERLSISCPDFKYPEPVFVYVKSVKTDKTIAVRLDGGDRTMRFWDYVDDDYSEEDGVWDRMGEKGLENFIKKLYTVMDHAFGSVQSRTERRKRKKSRKKIRQGHRLRVCGIYKLFRRGALCVRQKRRAYKIQIKDGIK